MVDTGLDAYRFSISWSRLIPGKSNRRTAFFELLEDIFVTEVYSIVLS